MGGDNFPLGKIFQEFLGGRKIFPPLFLVNFDVFLVDFDAKTQTGGENMPKIQNGGRKKEGGKDPWLGGTNFPEFFWGGENSLFPPFPWPLCMYAKRIREIKSFTEIHENQKIVKLKISWKMRN